MTLYCNNPRLLICRKAHSTENSVLELPEAIWIYMNARTFCRSPSEAEMSFKGHDIFFPFSLRVFSFNYICLRWTWHIFKKSISTKKRALEICKSSIRHGVFLCSIYNARDFFCHYYPENSLSVLINEAAHYRTASSLSMSSMFIILLFPNNINQHPPKPHCHMKEEIKKPTKTIQTQVPIEILRFTLEEKKSMQESLLDIHLLG